MKRYVACLLAIAVIGLVSMGCSKKNSTSSDDNHNTAASVDSTAGTLSVHSGNNTAVTSANEQEAASGVMETAMNAYSQAFDNALSGSAKTAATTDAFPALAQALAKTALLKSVVLSVGKVPTWGVAATQSGKVNTTINGYSGSATVTGTYSESETSASGNILCTFNDYCESSAYGIYLGGQMSFIVDATHNTSTGNISGSASLNGAIRFNGAYAGTSAFTISMTFSGNESGNMRTIVAYNIKFSSNGQTLEAYTGKDTVQAAM